MANPPPTGKEWLPIDDNPRPKARKRPPAQSSNKVLIFALVGFTAVLLLGCLIVGGGAAIYFAARSGPSLESQLIGHWEMDPEYLKQIAKNDPNGQLAANLIGGSTFDFNPDHTFKMTMLLNLDGKWAVTGRTGQTLHLTLIPRLFGMDAEPAQVNITMFDKDHFDFVAPPQKTMTGQGRYRRAGPAR